MVEKTPSYTLKQPKRTPKQKEAFEILKDPSVRYLLWGGAQGGGKSMLIAAFVLWSAFQYPDTRYLICRKIYKQLLETTVVSLFKVARDMGIEEVLLAGYNRQRGIIVLPNKSEILLRGVDPADNDPNFTSLRDEISFAAIDEAGEVESNVRVVLLSRIRHRVPPYGPTVLMCCNPSRNFAYEIFDQYEKGTLPKNTRYLHATMFDNPLLDEETRKSLTRENYPDESYWESQVMGNWRFEQTSTMLFERSLVEDAFEWNNEGADQRDVFLCWDPAYGGGDRSVVMVFRGMVLVHTEVMRKVDASEQVRTVKKLISEFHVPARNVSIDGIGSAALVSQFPGCVDHRANGRPINGEAYASLKDQLYYRLSQAFKNHELRLGACDHIKEDLSAELLAHKSYRNETDTNARITPKDQVSRSIGRSPDISDCLMQLMYFTYRPKGFSVDVIEW